jgi:hypothetical protein
LLAGRLGVDLIHKLDQFSVDDLYTAVFELKDPNRILATLTITVTRPAVKFGIDNNSACAYTLYIYTRSQVFVYFCGHRYSPFFAASFLAESASTPARHRVTGRVGVG